MPRGRKKGSKNRTAPIETDVQEDDDIVTNDRFIPNQGDSIETVDESMAHDKTETVRGINEGKVTKYGRPA